MSEKKPGEKKKTEHTLNNDEEKHHQELTTNKLFDKLNKEIQNLKGENQTLKQKLLHQNVCDKCGNVFDTKTQLQEHMNKQHIETKPNDTNSCIVKCGQCECIFTSKPQLEAHMRNKHADPPISIQHTSPPDQQSELHHPPLAGTSYNLYKGPFNPLPPLSPPGTEWNQAQGTKYKLKKPENQNKTLVVSKNPFRFSNVHTCNYCDEVSESQNQLKEHINKDHPNTIMEHEESENSDNQDVNGERENSSNNFKCPICNMIQNTKRKLERHLENHDEDGDWICECEFQTNEYFQLKRHLLEFKTHRMQLNIRSEQIHINDEAKSLQIEEETHHKTNKEDHITELQTKFVFPGDEYKCNFCESLFGSKRQMSRHRKDIHPTYKPCKNIDTCEFNESCYFNHDPIPEGLFRCFQCGENFQIKHLMMIHRKNEHEGVKPCQKFITNKCSRGDNCWWKHEGFQQAPPPAAPPQHPPAWSRQGLTPTPQVSRVPPTEASEQINQPQIQVQNQMTLMMKAMEANMKIMKNIIEITFSQQ